MGFDPRDQSTGSRAPELDPPSREEDPPDLLADTRQDVRHSPPIRHWSEGRCRKTGTAAYNRRGDATPRRVAQGREGYQAGLRRGDRSAALLWLYRHRAA